MFDRVLGWPGLRRSAPAAATAMVDWPDWPDWPDEAAGPTEPTEASDSPVECTPQRVVPWLADLPPGPEVICWLAATDPTALDRDGMLHLLVAFERAAGWLAHLQQRVLAALSAASVPGGLTGDAPPPPAGSEAARLAAADRREAEECLRAEVAAVLRLSMATAGRRVAEAETLAGRMADTGRALAAGDISTLQAGELAQASWRLDDATAAAVQRAVLAAAGDQSLAQTRRSIERAIAAADPGGAAERAVAAAARRTVTRQPLPDEMAEIRAVLPAPAAAACWQSLTAAAGSNRSEDPRAIGVRRADAFVALLTGGRLRPGGPTGAGAAGEPTGTGAAGEPTRTGATHGATRAGAADERTGAGATGEAAAGATGEAAAGATGETPAGATSETAASGPVGELPVLMHITVGADVLTGRSDAPALLDGYGPISADTARCLAGQARWHRLLTDPKSGALLDYGRTVYRPPVGLADHVRARDLTCRFPHCGQPARRCELDHTIAWAAGGSTAADNLSSLCSRHHRLKSSGRWQLSQDAAGHTWVSPTGRRFRLPHPDLTDPP